MVNMEIRDDVIWIKHLRDDDRLFSVVNTLEQNEKITLLVDGRPVGFRKMVDGKDGRPTPGLKADDSFKEFWKSLQPRRGEFIRVGLANEQMLDDPYLAAVSRMMEEWETPEDAAAFDDL